MVHKCTPGTPRNHRPSFHEIPYMASTPSNNTLLYITTEDSDDQQEDKVHALPNAGRRRLISPGHEESDDNHKVSPTVQSETISMIDAVAKTLCGDNRVSSPGGGDAFNQYKSRRRGSLPPIYINQKTTHNLQTMPEINLEETQCPDYSFSRTMQPDRPNGFNPGRRNSLMVPLPSKLDSSSPLIPLRPRERSHSLSPNRAAVQLSPVQLQPYQYETNQHPLDVPVRNLRRRSIGNIKQPLMENFERTESSLDFV